MVTEYSLEQMLAIWRTRMGIVATDDVTGLVRTDIADINAYLRQRIDDWYYQQLDTAPIQWLKIEDCSAEATVTLQEGRVIAVKLPDRCRRVVRVRLKGWNQDAQIVTDNNSRLAQLQRSEFTRGGVCRPVAVASGRQLLLYQRGLELPTLTALECVCDPAEGVYAIDRRALSTIPLIDINI
jgi:hypothetical protein